jgi:tRNA-dihydrouridine synthase A
MMEWSDVHCRYFWRLLTKKARLYTEMVTAPALIHGNRARFLAFNEREHPIALQLGGSNPKELATCAKLAEDAGFDEVNLNCGCPSDRVQEYKIGACLMAEPELVGECVSAMKQAVSIPVTVKHRIGIDDIDSEEHLHNFVGILVKAGCSVFIVHARKAWLNGLSPKENRSIPPLNYAVVQTLKSLFPLQTFIINGGLESINDCEQQLRLLDGVMVGRELYHNPYAFATVDQQLFGLAPAPSRGEVLAEFIDYAWQQHQNGVKLHHLTRHILGIYAAQPGGKQFRRFLSENATRQDASPLILEKALARIEEFN